MHRDLKPGNIMLTKQGTKLLDFGLARMDTASAPVSETLTRLADSDRKLTEEGVILGTFQYMAPEQLEGKDADARTDIFALGALLYEMATGKPAFAGKTRASLIASILASEPPAITSLQPLTPPALERVVKSCLAKDPDARWQSAQDVNLQLKWIQESGSGAGLPVSVARRRRTRELIAWLLVGLLSLVALGLGIREALRRSPDPVVTRFVIDPPPDHTFRDFPPVGLAPDGRKIALTVVDRQHNPALWLRTLDSIGMQELPGTEGAGGVTIWSPDSRFLMFIADDKVKRLDIAGGLPETLCDLKGMYPNSWGSNGTILLGNDVDSAGPGPIHVISLDDCRLQPVTKFDSTRYDFGHQWPFFLPDGHHFFYAGLRTDKRHDVLLGNVGSLESEVLVHNASDPKYSSGYLFFERDGYLLAQPFNPKTLKLSGESVQVEPDQLNFSGVGGMAYYDVSSNGELVYQKQGDVRNQLMIVDSAGKQIEALGDPGALSAIRISPDRSRVLASKSSLQSHLADLWTLDLRSHSWQRFSFDSTPGEHLGVWKPNGQEIVFSAFMKGHETLYRKTVNQSGDSQLLLENNFDKEPNDWSPDGRFLLFTQSDVKGVETFWILPLASGGKPYPLAETRINQHHGRFSPDGRWIAYTSDESGRLEVYVRPFPGSGDRQQISSGGGRQPCWSRDGRSLYYLTTDWKLMEVPLKVNAATLQPGTPHSLFSTPEDSEYEVFGDGKFLVSQQIGSLTFSPTVVLNWQAALNSKKK